MRDFILVYINGERVEVRGPETLLPLSDFLRRSKGITGTKVVCAEGDCGACTVLQATPQPGAEVRPVFLSINSCIAFMHTVDCSSLVTIEGLKRGEQLNALQNAMVKHHGAQCGFCTPGIVMALEELVESKKQFNEKNIKNYLSGNLCRCTGYQTIINAAMDIKQSGLGSLAKTYLTDSILRDLVGTQKIPLAMESSAFEFSAPVDIEAAIAFNAGAKDTRILAGATDLGVQINKRKTSPKRILSLKNISSLYELSVEDGHIYVGSRVTLDSFQNFVSDKLPELDNFLNIFASKQIKNLGTVVGNIVNASPIGDIPPALMVLNAEIEVQGLKQKRVIDINNFFLGYRKVDLKPSEVVTRLVIPIPKNRTMFKIYKVSQRRDLDISCVSAAFLCFADKKNITELRIAYGGVGATVLRLNSVESKFKGIAKKEFYNPFNVNQVVNEIEKNITPITDVRGSKKYRRVLAGRLYKKFVFECRERKI